MTWVNVKEKHSVILSGFTQAIALLVGVGAGYQAGTCGSLEVHFDLNGIPFDWVKLTFPLCGDC